MSNVIHESNFGMSNMILDSVLMNPCDMFLRYLLMNTSIVDMLGSGRGRVCGLGYAL